MASRLATSRPYFSRDEVARASTSDTSHEGSNGETKNYCKGPLESLYGLFSFDQQSKYN